MGSGRSSPMSHFEDEFCLIPICPVLKIFETGISYPNRHGARQDGQDSNEEDEIERQVPSARAMDGLRDGREEFFCRHCPELLSTGQPGVPRTAAKGVDGP